MPGSIQNAAPATVLPHSLSRAFARSQEYPVIENQYRNGESQRSVPVNNSRKRWRLAKRLPPTPLQALRDFYEARGGPTEPFYFYDPYETNPKFSWDPTGVATIGRYTVRFDGEWNQSSGIGRADVNIELVELFRLSWKWRERSPVKITERTREEITKALHCGREGRHSEAPFAGAGGGLEAL